MNSVQMHLALTHVPVILSLVGLVMLVVTFFIQNSTITKASYILIAGIASTRFLHRGRYRRSYWKFARSIGCGY